MRTLHYLLSTRTDAYPCSDVIPTFVLMDVQGAHLTIYKYQLQKDEVKVEKIEYKKE